MDILKSIALFLAKGKVIMFAYTVNMIALSWYATKNDKTIDGSVAAMYLGALTAFGAKKGIDAYQEWQTKKKKPAALDADAGDI